jgi:hypothetical protein
MATLAKHGWLPIASGPTATASKEFPSLFGVKEPQVHCAVHASTANRQMQLHLRGDFFSEGRNALAKATDEFPVVSTAAEVAPAVQAWIGKAEAAMGNTFAVRMLRQQQAQQRPAAAMEA